MASEVDLAPRDDLFPRAPVNLCGELGGEFVPGATIGESAGLVLRFARDADAPAIIALITAVWAEYPGKTLVAKTDMPELLQPATTYAKQGGRFWVVEAGFPRGKIIGTVALQPSKEPGVVELQKLYVERSMRRNGLGGFLCQLVEHEARRRGAHAIELWSDVKLLDAHRRYERLGYQRGEELKTYNDTSGTVRYYYRKALAAEMFDLTDHPSSSGGEGKPAAGERWRALLSTGADASAPSRDTTIKKWPSFTEHPASVGESYFEHLRHAGGFAVSMIRGGLACLVHAVLPFLFTHTGSGIVADLNVRMITNRRQQPAVVSTMRSVRRSRNKRASAA